MSDRFLHRIAGLVFNTPLAIDEQAGRVVLAALGDRVGLNVVNAGVVTPVELQASSFYGQRCEGGYVRTQGGTAIVPVVGELVNRGSYLGAPSGLTSYEGLQQQARLLAEDQNVKSIVLDMKSPGGEFSGMIETAAAFKRLDAKKPVFAVVNDLAASAAYCIASAARKIIVSPFGRVGSIGVITFHADMSKALAKGGVTVTIMQAGAHKADGSPMLPLDPAVKAEMMGVIGGAYDKFVKAVALNRPKLGEKAARETEARVYWDSDAVDAGLADAVGTLDALLAGLGDAPRAQSAPRDSLFGKGDGMTKVTAITTGLSARQYFRDPDNGEFADDGKPNQDERGGKPSQDNADEPASYDGADEPASYDGEEPASYDSEEPASYDDEPAMYDGDGAATGRKMRRAGMKKNDAERPAPDRRHQADRLENKRNRQIAAPDNETEDQAADDDFMVEEDARQQRDAQQKRGRGPQGPKGKTMSEREIRAAERARITKITTSEEAKGRESLAAHFAHETGMSAEAAIAALKASAKAAPAVALAGAGVAGAELSGNAAPAITIDASAIYAARNNQFRS